MTRHDPVPDVVLNDLRARQVEEPKLVDSLHALVKLAAWSDTGGGRVAAKVILSAYSGTQYPLDIAELRGFDSEHFAHAMRVIRLRYIGYEPHSFFVEGGELLTESLSGDNYFFR